MFSRQLPRFAALAGVWTLAVCARVGAAQQPPTPPTAPAPPPVAMDRSTLAGVYTSAQAEKGKTAFLNLCVSCHNLSTQSGAAFALRWGGHPLSELWVLVKDRMPIEEPLSYSPVSKAQIVAYLLKLNGMPAGATELPTDVETLQKIRIEIPSADKEK